MLALIPGIGQVLAVLLGVALLLHPFGLATPFESLLLAAIF